MGDFSSISSTDMFTMSAVRSIVRQFGEFSVEIFSVFITELPPSSKLSHV